MIDRSVRGSETAGCALETALVAKDHSSSASRLVKVRNFRGKNNKKIVCAIVRRSVAESAGGYFRGHPRHSHAQPRRLDPDRPFPVPDDQRESGNDCGQARVSRGLPRPALPDPRRRVLRVRAQGQGQAALLLRPERRRPDGVRRPLGTLDHPGRNQAAALAFRLRTGRRGGDLHDTQHVSKREG